MVAKRPRGRPRREPAGGELCTVHVALDKALITALRASARINRRSVTGEVSTAIEMYLLAQKASMVRGGEG